MLLGPIIAGITLPFRCGITGANYKKKTALKMKMIR
jgi:hypothetical protein